MPETTQKSEQAQPASKTRRDQFAIAFGAAIMTRQSGRSPKALAKEVVAFTDAFLFELDTPKGA